MGSVLGAYNKVQKDNRSKKISPYIIRWVIYFTAAILMSSATAKEGFSQRPPMDFPSNVYWGDTHLHTTLSVDGFAAGTNISPEQAYIFAKGGAVTRDDGVTIRLNRALDFIVIADHAENMGLLAAFESGFALEGEPSEAKRRYQEFQEQIPLLRDIRLTNGRYPKGSGPWMRTSMRQGPVGSPSFTRSVWEKVAKRADKYNDPGEFTAFSAYEWSPMRDFVHRVVLFDGNSEAVTKSLPFSQFDSPNVEDLWSYLEEYEVETKSGALAIPHNGNLSRGNMFKVENSFGQPFTSAYARVRQRWEPLVEVTQQKGDSETHPSLSPNDQFSNYAKEYADSFHGKTINLSIDEKRLQRKHEYTRSALKLGLEQKSTLGVNPFKFGMIGGTDSHMGLSSVGVNSDLYYGILASDGNFIENRSIEKLNVAGYAAVWAKENTRESIFSAMKRKEVYASTGSRITLRFFGGWDYNIEDADNPNLASIGYKKGVPMGGDLTHGPKGTVPSFLIRATKDPKGANLDRLQIIKGWLSGLDGKSHEKIYNIALSDGRTENPSNGKVDPVGSTVDVASASYMNSIGDAELAVVWKDPDFNQKELAFYYVRVLEIPTPRWHAKSMRDRNSLEAPVGIPIVAQERAYSSPIWYSPPAKAGGE